MATSKTVTARSPEELDQKINSVTAGRKVKNISQSHVRDGNGIVYTATILLEQEGSRQLLMEG